MSYSNPLYQDSYSFSLAYSIDCFPSYGESCCANTTEEEDTGRTETYIVPPLFGLITIVGLFGNFSIIFVTFRDRKMRGVTNFFIMNNAISDIMFLVLCVPITASQFVWPSWGYGRIVCKFFAYIQHVSISSFLGACITLLDLWFICLALLLTDKVVEI